MWPLKLSASAAASAAFHSDGVNEITKLSRVGDGIVAVCDRHDKITYTTANQ
jgi:hypothetical protein